MEIAAWIVSIVLGAVFTISGIAKVSFSRERLIATGQTGIAPFPMPLVRVVAVAELLAVVGLFVPWLTGIAPILTPLAALGLGAVMTGAVISHASLREPKAVAANVSLMWLIAFTVAVRLGQL